MRKALLGIGIGTLMGALLAGCATTPTVLSGSLHLQQPAARTRILTAARPNANQTKLLSQFSKEERRPVTLKRDSFGHPVIGPTLSAAESTLLKTLDADRRLVREAGVRALPAGLTARASKHFQFFQPSAKTVTPRLSPLYQANGQTLIGFRAEVELPGTHPDDGPARYFAYYDRQGRLLAANG